MKRAAVVLILVLVLVQVLQSAADERQIIRAACDETHPPKPCNDDGWFRTHNDLCMKLMDEPSTFDEAEQCCLCNGGHLVSMHNVFEYNDVLCLLFRFNSDQMQPAWMGLRKEVGSTVYQYSDGTGLDFDRWVQEPTSTKEEDEVCIRMNHQIWGHWSPLGCNEELPFVCAKIIIL